MPNENILIKFISIEGLDLYEAYDRVKEIALHRGEVVETVIIPSLEPGPYLLNEFKNDPRCVSDPLKKDSLGNSVITMSDEIPNYIVYIKIIASRINSYPSNSRVNGLKCLSFSEYKDSLLPGYIFVGTVINTYNDGVIWQYASNDLEDCEPRDKSSLMMKVFI